MGALEILFHGDDHAARVALGCRAHPGLHADRKLVEDHQDQLPGVNRPDRLDTQHQVPFTVGGTNRQRLRRPRAKVLLTHEAETGAQTRAQRLEHHLQQVVRQLTARDLQERPRRGRVVRDLIGVVHQHAGRRVSLHRLPVNERGRGPV